MEPKSRSLLQKLFVVLVGVLISAAIFAGGYYVAYRILRVAFLPLTGH